MSDPIDFYLPLSRVSDSRRTVSYPVTSEVEYLVVIGCLDLHEQFFSVGKTQNSSSQGDGGESKG
jgi:hypothetical protein